MKKLLLSLFVLATFAIGADVRPFVFENVSQDLETQQDQWETLVKYKLWGTVGIYLSNEGSLAIEEQNGYTGTAHGNINAEKDHHLGGPIIVGGKLTIGTTSQLTNIQLAGGPVRADTIRVPDWAASQMGNSIFDGPYCVKSDIYNNGNAYDYTVDVLKSKITGGYYVGENYDQCPVEVPLVDTALRVPTVNLDTVSNWEPGIDLAPTGENIVIGYIHVPPDSVYTNEYGTVDKFLTKLRVAKVPSFRIYVVMPPTGRLTRIFVKDGFELDNSPHNPRIQVMYVPEGNVWNKSTNQWDLTEVKDSTKFTYVEEYQGNLLFYTDKRVDWGSTDGPVYQGTFITTDTMRIGNDFSVSGQLIAKYIYIRTPYLGKFKYVPFDPPVIDIDPTALASGKFVENNTDVTLPVKLDIAPITNVTFNYCYKLKDTVGVASIADFNNAIPVCGVDSGEVKILKGTKTPLVSPILNVKIDDVTEYDERLILYVFNLNGAVMPNKQLSGYFNLTITDGGVFQIDTTKTYSVDENIANVDIGIISIIGKTDSTKLFLSQNDTAKYNLDSLTGLLTLKLPYDYETTQYDTITVIANDTVSTDTAKIVIIITDINEAPAIEDQTLTLLENLPIPSIVGTVVVFDEDKTSEFRKNNFKIIEGDTSTFVINNNGQITAKKKFNYETDDSVYTLKVMVYDSIDPTLSDTATITIKISDTNEGPKFAVDDTTFFVDENKVPGVIGNVAAIDEDGDTITYTIVGTVPFTIDSVGNIKSTRTFDYETETGFTFKVVATDGEITDTLKVNVKINNVNEECTVRDTTFKIDENKTGKVGNVKATDKDKDNIFGTITYSIGDTANYQIDKDGNVFVKTPINYEDNDTVSVKVYITDGTHKDSAVVKIAINNVPEDIVVNGLINPIEENVDLGTPVGYITGLDGDSTNVTYTINTTDFKIDPITGVITTNSVIDYETQNEYPVIVTVKSTDGSTKDTSFTITVVNVNEPVHVNGDTLSVDEHKTGEIGKVEAYDEDNEEVSYSIDDTTNYSIDDDGKICVIKPFDYKEKPEDTLIVYVSTTNGDKDTAQIIIKINDVNDPPVLQPNDSLNVPENCDTCVVGKITATDPDDDPIEYKVVEEGFTIDTNGILTITKPLDYETNDEVTITIIATDKPKTGTPISDTLKYTIKITDVNEPVHVNDTTFTVPENDTTSWKLIGSDEDGDSLKCYSGASDNYIVDSNCTISLITPFDFETMDEDSITVYVTDNRGSLDSAKIKIKVTDVNEKVNITEVDDKPKQDTIKTNNPDHNAKYEICEGTNCETGKIDITVKKDTTVKVCNTKGTVCDSVVFLFNDVPPLVTLVNAKTTTTDINYITIEEQKDDKVYVNTKENEIKVVVEDTIHHIKQEFPITIELDTVKNVSKAITEYKYVLDETKATVTPIGNGLAEMKEIVFNKETGDSVEVVVLVDAQTLDRKDSVQTITYKKKVDGKLVTVTYKSDDVTGARIGDYQVAYNIDSATTVTYNLNDKKEIVKNEEGNIGYSITYEYTDEYGNKSNARIDIVYDNIPPVVEILSPIEKDIFKTNAIEVKWTVNGIVQDTLTLQRLEKGVNAIVRRYVDKAGNESIDTVLVIMKEAKDIDVKIINPVTEVSKEKVDEWYSEGNEYNPKKPYEIKIVNPKADSVPEPIGVGFMIDVALPSVSATGNVSTLSDIIKNDKVPVDDKGNVVGASNFSIPVEEYINENCTDEFIEDYHKNGTNIPLYNVKYNLHLWIYTSNANYVNDFEINYDIDAQTEANSASIVSFVIDWVAEKDGNVKAKNQHSLGTGAYLVKLYSKSTSIYRCGFKNQKAGDKIIKKEYNLKSFGYKRPNK